MQIYVLNRARETLATTGGIYDDKHTLTLDAGSSSYEFKIDKADEASQYMDSGNYIVLQDDDGKTWLFTILDYEETQYTKTVYAEDAGIELLNKACDIWKSSGPHSFEYYFNLVTNGTPWKLGVNQLAGLERTLTYEGRDTGLGRLLSILKGFDDAECTFDVAVKMNAPSDFKINVYKQVGSDRSDVQMVYSHELNDITKKESRAEFVTALCGVGGTVTPPEGQEVAEQENISFVDLEYSKDGLVTTKGDKFLRAVDANKRFNPGQTTYIEAFYEYDTQSASELLNRTITRLKTYSEPQYTYTADVKIIDSTLKIGDTVTIIDHDYNPALYLSARVAKLEKSYTDPSQNTIEFCNYQLLSSRLADKLAKLQTIVNKMPSASQVGKLESNVSNLSTKTEELASQITSANGKNTNFYGKTEPASPKNGDLWYKKLGNGEIEMYQYQDGTWQLLASTADLTTVQTELDQAKADMEQAKTDAQTAYDEAIKATNTANGAKAQTAEALEQAKQVQKDLSSVTGTIVEVKKDQNELSAKVADKVDNAVYQTYVTQTDKALSTKLTESDLQGYAKTADVKQTTDGLSASITKVQGDLNGLQIGGANLLDDTEKERSAKRPATGHTDIFVQNLATPPTGTVFTASFEAKATTDKTVIENHFYDSSGKYADGKCLYTVTCQTSTPTEYTDGRALLSLSTQWKRYWITWTWSQEMTQPDIHRVLIGRYQSNYSDGTVYIRRVKLEKGNKTTDWCMSDNDFQSQLNTLSGKITATSERLSSVYTKSETDAKLGTKVEQSALTQTSNNLSASIAENSKILSSIGLTSDTAYINASKIALNGKTLMSNAVVNDAFIGNLSADKVTTGTLNAAKVNVINLDASKITTGTLTAVDIHQSSAGADTWINKDGIHNQMGSNNVWVKRGTLAAFDSSGQGMYMESGQLTLASYAYWQNAGKPESIDYGVIKCDDDITDKKGIGVIGKGGFSLRTDNSDVNGWTGNEMMGYVTAGAGIIGTDDGKLILGSLKPTFIEGGRNFKGYDSYNHTPFIQVGGEMAKAGSSLDKNGSSVVINAWDIKLKACGPNDRNIILNRLTYNGEHSIDLNDGTSDLWWGPKMHAPSFVNTSALSKKMNITKLDTQTAINAIKNTDIYDYQFKEYGITGKHYASLIIDDVNDRPQYKAAGAFVDGLGRDDGTQLGYLTVVVQSLLKEIDTLKERIDK